MDWGTKLLHPMELDGTAYWAGRRVYCPVRKRALTFSLYIPSCPPEQAKQENAKWLNSGQATNLEQAAKDFIDYMNQKKKSKKKEGK